MVQQRIRRHAGVAKAWVHLNQNQHHHRPECHLCYMVVMWDLQVRISMVCHPDMCICILLFRTLDHSVLMHTPRITTSVKILLLIWWLMKEYPLLNTLSAAWVCSWHPFFRWAYPIVQTWKWWRALTERNGIFEYYYHLQLVDTFKYILKDQFIWIIKEQCSDKGESPWKW